MKTLCAIPTLFFLLSGLISLPIAASGQVIRIGDPVRVSHEPLVATAGSEGWRPGVIERFAGDSILIRYADQGSEALRARHEVRVRDGHHGGRGWLIGAAAGAVVGGVSGAVTSSAVRAGKESLERGLECFLVSLCDQRNRRGSPSRGGSAEAVLGGMVGGALVFGGLGWLIGRAVPRWAPLDDIEVTARPDGLSARIAAP